MEGPVIGPVRTSHYAASRLNPYQGDDSGWLVGAEVRDQRAMLSQAGQRSKIKIAVVHLSVVGPISFRVGLGRYREVSGQDSQRVGAIASGEALG